VALADRFPGLPPFELAVLQDKLTEASRAVDTRDHEKPVIQRALLYLAALRAKDQKLADEQWKLLLDALARGDRHHRQLGEMLTGKRPATADALKKLPIEASQKRALLGVAAEKHPELKKELLPLARKLNFQRDPTSLCLRKVLEEEKPGK
jgi:hypothetical protein